MSQIWWKSFWLEKSKILFILFIPWDWYWVIENKDETHMFCFMSLKAFILMQLLFSRYVLTIIW